MAKVEIKIKDVNTAVKDVDISSTISKKDIEDLLNTEAKLVIPSHFYAVLMNNSFKETQKRIGQSYGQWLRINCPKATVTITIHDKDDGKVAIECRPSRAEISTLLKGKGISPAMVYALEALEFVVAESRKSKSFVMQ